MKTKYLKYFVWFVYVISLYFLVYSSSMIIRNQDNYESLVDSYKSLAKIYEEHVDLDLLGNEKREIVEKIQKDILWKFDKDNYSGVKLNLSLYYWLFILGLSGMALPNIIKQNSGNAVSRTKK